MFVLITIRNYSSGTCLGLYVACCTVRSAPYSAPLYPDNSTLIPRLQAACALHNMDPDNIKVDPGLTAVVLKCSDAFLKPNQ